MTSFFILLSSIYSHSVHFQNLLRAEKLFHFKFPIDWYITLTCLSNFNFEVFFQAAIMNYAQYGVMPRCCRWGFLICVSWHLPLTLCKISTLYVFFSGLGDFLANSATLKRSKTLNEVKPVENITKNLQSFLELSPMQKEVLLSQKLWDHAYEYENPFELKEDNLWQRNCQNQLSHPGLCHT